MFTTRRKIMVQFIHSKFFVKVPHSLSINTESIFSLVNEIYRSVDVSSIISIEGLDIICYVVVKYVRQFPSLMKPFKFHLFNTALLKLRMMNVYVI